MQYLGDPAHDHDATERLGVLLVNSGTPDSTSTRDVRRFLGRLLGDPRVVELPRALWLPLLHGIILRTRPRRSARKYRRIWTPLGSPLMQHSLALRQQLTKALGERVLAPIAVEIAPAVGGVGLSPRAVEQDEWVRRLVEEMTA